MMFWAGFAFGAASALAFMFVFAALVVGSEPDDA